MTDGSPAAKPSRPRIGVSPRALLIAIIIVLIIGALVFLGLWFFLPRGDDPWGEVEFVTLAEEDTATVGFAGSFPGDGAMLATPTGMATDGESILVAVRDAGEIARFMFDGALVETLTVPTAIGRDIATPVSVAALDDGRLAVVDSAAPRVLVMDPDTPGESIELAEGSGRLSQPTAVTATSELIIVSDAMSGLIELFTYTGEHAGALGGEIQPPLSFVGGLHVSGMTLYVSDSTAGRVLLIDLESGEQIGTLQERIGLPRGIATDGDRRVFVADAFDGRVLLFGSDDYLLKDVIGSESTRRLEEGGVLGSPQGLVWDPETRFLYVADTTAGKIKVYEVRTMQ